jgi:type I restriction enzyme S subunit
MDKVIMENKVLNVDKSTWRMTKLGDLLSDISQRVDNPSQSGYQRFVGLEHFISGDIKIKNWGATDNLTSSTKAFKSDDILFARRNAYLRRASLVDFDGCCSGDAFVLRENHEKVVPGFMAFFFNSNAVWDFANENAAGTMSQRVKWRDLANYEFLLPPKDQQAQLAELLWAMDEVIERENQLLNSTQTYLVSYREKVLIYGKEFVSLEKLISGITAGKSVNGTNMSASGDEKGVLKVSAVGPNGFDPNENKRITKQIDFDSKYAIRKDDILITRANTTELVGRVCLVPQNYPNQMLCDKTLRLEYLDGVNKHFLVSALTSRPVRNQIEGFATGTGGAMKNISQQEIKSLKIPAKSFFEQLILGETIRATNETIEMVRNKISTSRALQKSLINQIF